MKFLKPYFRSSFKSLLRLQICIDSFETYFENIYIQSLNDRILKPRINETNSDICQSKQLTSRFHVVLRNLVMRSFQSCSHEGQFCLVNYKRLLHILHVHLYALFCSFSEHHEVLIISNLHKSNNQWWIYVNQRTFFVNYFLNIYNITSFLQNLK